MANIKNSVDVINIFVGQAAQRPEFVDLLVTSLTQAKASASKALNADLFAALDWPTSLEAYVAYLTKFSEWVPQQSGDEIWQQAGTDEHQEVYDRLTHFYYLIDQPVECGIIVQNIPWFSEWLVSYADYWGSFLNTTDSFNDAILQSYIDYAPLYRVEDSMIQGKPNNPSGWLTFNQFFARELNPGLRPIASPTDNTIITSPADCTYREQFPIDANSEIPEITVKKTHKFASVKELLKGSKYADAFANGTFVHYFLNTYSYHRFHTPVAGTVKESYAIHGKVYLDVNIVDGQFDAPDNADGGYEFSQARGVITIDTSNSPYGNVGIVAVIPIGMAQVSSVNMIATVGSEALKGDEFGYFLFGGSDIIVLFQEGVNPRIYQTPSQYTHYGEPIANGKRL